MALSPDGMTVAIVAAQRGESQLYLRRLDDFEVALVRDSRGAREPFFSPDGR